MSTNRKSESEQVRTMVQPVGSMHSAAQPALRAAVLCAVLRSVLPAVLPVELLAQSSRRQTGRSGTAANTTHSDIEPRAAAGQTPDATRCAASCDTAGCSWQEQLSCACGAASCVASRVSASARVAGGPVTSRI